MEDGGKFQGPHLGFSMILSPIFYRPEFSHTSNLTAGLLGIIVQVCTPEEKNTAVGAHLASFCHRLISNTVLVFSAFILTIPQFRESLRSYAATPWPLEPQHYLSFTEFEITFRPDSGDGVLLYSYDTGSKDFLSINMAGGHVEFRFDCGSGTGVLR